MDQPNTEQANSKLKGKHHAPIYDSMAMPRNTKMLLLGVFCPRKKEKLEPRRALTRVNCLKSSDVSCSSPSRGSYSYSYLGDGDGDGDGSSCL